MEVRGNLQDKTLARMQGGLQAMDIKKILVPEGKQTLEYFLTCDKPLVLKY